MSGAAETYVFPPAPPPPDVVRRREGEAPLRAGHPLALAVLAGAGLVIEPAEVVTAGPARRAA